MSFLKNHSHLLVLYSNGSQEAMKVLTCKVSKQGPIFSHIPAGYFPVSSTLAPKMTPCFYFISSTRTSFFMFFFYRTNFWTRETLPTFSLEGHLSTNKNPLGKTARSTNDKRFFALLVRVTFKNTNPPN